MAMPTQNFYLDPDTFAFKKNGKNVSWHMERLYPRLLLLFVFIYLQTLNFINLP